MDDARVASTRKRLSAPIIALADIDRSRLGKIIRLLPSGGDEPRILSFPLPRPHRGGPPDSGPAVA
jgi:hypothetical protein